MRFADPCAIDDSDASDEYSSLARVGTRLYVGLRLLDRRGGKVKTHPAIFQPDSARPVADELVRDEKHDKAPNPLWVINIAMAAFFIVAALVTMFSS